MTVAVLAALALLAMLFIVTGPSLAQGTSTEQARHAMQEARAQYREAVRVYEATRTYSRVYGASVGRWTALARETGWTWSQMPRLMYVVNRESRGNPRALNPSSGCAGLLQLHPCHHVAHPFVPKVNLSFGLKLWREAGWQPWSL